MESALSPRRKVIYEYLSCRLGNKVSQARRWLGDI